MRRFKWNDWNRQKVAAHRLSPDEVESGFENIVTVRHRRDGSVVMLADLPSGRRIQIIWRYDHDSDAIPDVFGDPEPPLIFVITAY